MASVVFLRFFGGFFVKKKVMVCFDFLNTVLLFQSFLYLLFPLFFWCALFVEQDIEFIKSV